MRNRYLCASFVLGAGVCANAGALTNPSMLPGEAGIDALILQDGEWTYGRLSEDSNNDWWTSGNTFLIRENWGGSFGSAVGFDISAASVDAGFVFPIGISKNVTNSTDFVWTGFDIFIDAAFSEVTITDNGDGSFLISYTVGTGTGVALGGSTVFDFNFDIGGGIDFHIVQTPIPTPGSAVLLTIAGLAAARRRR